MTTQEIQIPTTAAATFKSLAAWVREDLHQRKAHAPEWDERLIYRLPATVRGESCPGAAIIVKRMTDTIISVMPHEHGSLSGVWLHAQELDNPTDVAAHRLRVILMRVSKHAYEIASGLIHRTK